MRVGQRLKLKITSGAQKKEEPSFDLERLNWKEVPFQIFGNCYSPIYRKSGHIRIPTGMANQA